MENIKSVLIIDDDEDDVFLIQDRLSDLAHAQCVFVCCCDKEEAIEHLKTSTFNICILDYRLADYKGIDILRAVADDDLATPIIMLTGQNNNDLAKEAIKLGAQDFLPKSLIDDDIFEKSVLYAISRKELEFAKLLGRAKESESIAKDKFIAHLSHELRTPLTSILGYTSLLLEKKEADPLKKELSIIANNGKHLLNLLNDVLDLSKIAADKFELREQDTDLEQVLAEIEGLLRLTALDKGLRLAFKSVSKIPKMIKIDELRFKQVLVNILGNAIKFTDDGGVELVIEFIEYTPDTTDLAGESTTPSSQIIITIIDTGIGMDNQQIQTVFSPFEQVEDVTNRKAGGAGLGLSISAEIVRQMGGTLNLESSLGKGSIFTLCFPCYYAPQALIDFDFTVKPERASAPSCPKLKGRVLIVDDIFEIRQLAGYFVKQTGAVVEYAKHGEEAVAMVKQSLTHSMPFDVIFMDLHMPVMTGTSAMKNIHQIIPSLTVYAMTAAVSKGLLENVHALGFSGLIGKPIDKLKLWKILKQHLLKDTITLGDNAQQTSATKQNQAINKSLPTVHLIEDDEDSANIMSLMITALGFKVIHSITGEQALINIKNGAIAVHLVDLGLPDISGENLIKAFFSQKPSGRVFILSGKVPKQALIEHYPIEGHLLKPIDKAMLTKILLHQQK
jgi:signal transduction histidine kinase